MKAIFSYLFEFSAVTSAVILLAILLRPVLKKGPSFVRCLLWALVFLRLLLPVGLAEIPYAAPALLEGTQETVSTPAGEPVTDAGTVRDPAQTPEGQSPDVQPPSVQEPVGQTPEVQAPEGQSPEVQPPVQTPEGQSPEVQPPAQSPVQTPEVQPPVTDPNPGTALPDPPATTDWLLVLSAVWAAGVTAMLGYMLISNLLLRRRVRNAIVYDSGVRVIDRDCSPFVFGLFRPIIYIPATVNKADWPYIIAHETSHIKRFDHVLKPLAFFVLCFYWYNPLVWAAYILFGKDIEYACDERTVKRMETDDRKAYSLALLAVSQRESILFAPPLSFGRVSVKERIKRVMKRRIPLWAMCLTVILCVSLLFLTVFTLAAADSNDRFGSTDNGDTSSEGEGPVGLPVFSVAYASPDELTGDSLFYDEQGYELIRVSADREVKGFKFIEVLYDDDANPYAGKTLYEVASLSPDTPFYAQTDIHEGLGDRGISFEDGNGQTVSYRMMYDSYGNEMTDNSLSLEVIPNDPGGEENPVSGQIHSLPEDLFGDGAPIALIGEWVYYGDRNDRYDNLLWGRVRLDGSDRQQYTNDGMQSPLVTEDRIYYIDLHDGNRLYAMNHDGTGVTLLVDEKLRGLDAYRNGRLYYYTVDDPVEKYDPVNDEYYIDWGVERDCSVKPDGTDRQQQAVIGIPEPDGWIYALVNEYEDRRIYKIRPDGSGETVLTTLRVDEFRIYDGWVYFNLQQEATGLYRVRTDGSVTEKLCDDAVNIYSMAFDGTNVYYISPDNPNSFNGDGTLYAIRYDGTGRRKLTDKQANGLTCSDSDAHLLTADGVVFFQSGSALYQVSPDGTDEKLIAKNAKAVLLTDSGFFYTASGGNFLYRFASPQEPPKVAGSQAGGRQEPPEPTEALTLPDFAAMSVSDFFYEGGRYFDVAADTFTVIDRYVRGDLDGIRTMYATAELPAQAPRNTIADYRDYCITQVSAEPYTADGKQVEKLTVAASLTCVKEGQAGNSDYRLEFVRVRSDVFPYREWQLLRLEVQSGAKPAGDASVPLTDPMTVQDFLASSVCQELQATAFNFINAYFGGDYETVRQMFVAPSWALERPEAWESRSRDDYSGYGISWVRFEPDELDGKQVQKAHFHLSMYRAVPGEEGVYDPYIELVYVDSRWRVLSLDFSA